RNWSFVCDHGRPWRQFAWHVSPAFTVLFRDGLREFLSVVDQVAMAGSDIVATAKGRRHPPSPRLRRKRRRRLQRKIDRQVSSLGHRHHFYHLYPDQDEVAPLHLAGFSAAFALARAALARSGDCKPRLLA